MWFPLPSNCVVLKIMTVQQLVTCEAWWIKTSSIWSRTSNYSAELEFVVSLTILKSVYRKTIAAVTKLTLKLSHFEVASKFFSGHSFSHGHISSSKQGGISTTTKIRTLEKTSLPNRMYWSFPYLGISARIWYGVPGRRSYQHGMDILLTTSKQSLQTPCSGHINALHFYAKVGPPRFSEYSI